MTYIKNDIIFTELKTPHTTNNKLTELQHIKIHLANHKHLNIFNIYIYIYIYIHIYIYIYLQETLQTPIIPTRKKT